MKNIICLLLTILSFTVVAQRDSVHIKNSIFELCYSEKYKEPIWIKYTVLCPEGTADRTGMNFYVCDSVITSSNADYAHTEFDKGHMAPAADFNCTAQMLHETFTYLNCALQNKYLNRGVWKSLESMEREYALKETVQVTILVDYSKSTTKSSTGALIPTGFYKTLHLIKSNATYKYYFLNSKPISNNVSDYLVK